MIVVGDWVWRGGTWRRILGVGLPVGLFLGLFSFAESGILLAGLLVVLIVVPVSGFVTARRMARSWPGARSLSPGDRQTVVRATRRGENIGEARLASSVIEYSDALAEGRRGAYHWIVWAGAVATGVMAVLDTIFGTLRETLVSWAWCAVLAVESLWWPRRESRLLRNADRAKRFAHEILASE